MGEWRQTTLGALCEAVVDCEHKTAPIDRAGQYFAVGTPAMQGNMIDYAEARRVSATTFEAWTRRLRPRFGDLLLAREAPVGPVVRIPREENVAPGQRTVLLRPATGTDSRFLYYLLTSGPVQAQMASMAEGSTVRHLNVADVRVLAISAPTERSEQRAIADVLGALDDKIAANTRLAVAAEDLALVLAATATGGMRLRDLASDTRAMVAPDALDVSSVDLYSLPAYDTGRTPEHVAPDTIKSGKFALSGPSVLISKLNPRIPRIWQVSDVGDAPALASTEFVVLVPAGTSSAVLWALAMQPWVSESLQSQVAGTSGSHQRVKPADVLATRVADPATLSAAAHTQIESCAARAQAARIESSRLAATRDALLPALMSGALRVRDAERIASDLT